MGSLQNGIKRLVRSLGIGAGLIGMVSLFALSGIALGQSASAFHVALVIPGTLGDKGFFDSAAGGMRLASKKLGVSIKILQANPADPQVWLQNLQSVSKGGYQLVVTGTSQMTDFLTQVAKTDPKQHFIFFDDSVKLPNVANILYRQNQGSFLAGVLAGIVATSPKEFPLGHGSKVVGVVGGMNIPIINTFIAGYTQGVHFIDPTIRVLKSFVGSWSDPSQGLGQAQAMYDQGASIVYAVAGGTGLGVLKESKLAKRYSIGVDEDQNGLYPGYVLASMVKNVGKSLYDLIKLAKEGKLTYGGKVYPYGLNNEGVGLIIAKKYVPASVVERIDAATKQVASGKVSVQSTYFGY